MEAVGLIDLTRSAVAKLMPISNLTERNMGKSYGCWKFLAFHIVWLFWVISVICNRWGRSGFGSGSKMFQFAPMLSATKTLPFLFWSSFQYTVVWPLKRETAIENYVKICSSLFLLIIFLFLCTPFPLSDTRCNAVTHRTADILCMRRAAEGT